MSFLRKINSAASLQKFFRLLDAGQDLRIFCGAGEFAAFLCAASSLRRESVCVVCENAFEAEETFFSLKACLELLEGKARTFLVTNRMLENTEGLIAPSVLRLTGAALDKKEPLVAVMDRAGALTALLPDISSIGRSKITLQAGATLPMEKLLRDIIGLGYERVKHVELASEVSQRGGIIDVFPVNAEEPLRIEFFGDQIESIRTFWPVDQSAKEKIAHPLSVFPRTVKESAEKLIHFLFPRSLVFCLSLRENAEACFSEGAGGKVFFTPNAEDCDIRFDAVSCDLLVPRVPGQSAKANLSLALQSISSDTNILALASDAYSLSDMRSLFSSAAQKVSYALSSLPHGFFWEEGKTALLTFDDITKKQIPQKIGNVSAAQKIFERITETLKKGDIVVHTQYGLGRFIGITRMSRAEDASEHLVIEFAEKARLYVPCEQFYMVQKYIGLQEKEPALDSLHSKRWTQKKKRIQQDLFAYAAELLRMEAERNLSQGFSFKEHAEWVKEFENAFLYEDTPDQKKTTQEVYEDMESEKPMDRIVLGDVGYGKTEIAMRAAFKAAVNGKQTAVLVPTTILAEQHGHTFRERMAEFPVRVDVLNRFQPKEKQLEVIENLREGRVDVVIGTHRILQRDIQFKQLGLIIIDEEQKFGVKQKNALRSAGRSADILTLSATPIPRTLYLSLMGSRSISLIQTPPVDRKPIKTIVTHVDRDIIRKAIELELKRGGQVYVIHNRIETIFGIARWIRALVPSARTAVAHGRMDRNALKTIMEDFYSGRVDVLISTIIVQSGIDIRNVNTMIIHNADMFGLADLYQLRGRIGRADRMAYAYLLISNRKSGDAAVQERIEAIREFTAHGGHFKVALKDLEIRGAGNLLGTKQSGHIATIGFDLYCKLLDDTVRTMKGESVTPLFDVSIDIPVDAFLPADYVPDFMDRFAFYKRLYSAGSESDISAIRFELKDRFGPLPREAELFLKMGILKWLCRGRLISRVHMRREHLLLYRGKKPFERFEVPEEIRTSPLLLMDFLAEKMKRIEMKEDAKSKE